MAERIPRVPVREQDPEVRAHNFEEVCYGYNVEEARLEASRCLNCKNPRCMAACPVGVKIPQFIALVKDGDFAGAAAKIAEDSSLPAICGRVCPQETQCEGSCILGIKSEPVAIGKLERFVADYARENSISVPAPKAAPSGRKVAVIGSGPSGLMYLKKRSRCLRHIARSRRRAAYRSKEKPQQQKKTKHTKR